MTITILLTVAAKRMAAQQVLVKNLQAVETLGSITCVATDKTGTLTQNKMKVSGGWVRMERSENLNGEISIEPFKSIIECYWAASQIDLARLTDQDISNQQVRGDATELGLFWFAQQWFRTVASIPRLDQVVEIPFDSVRKWNLVISRSNDGYTSNVKGAPDRIIKLCSCAEAANGETVPINDDFQREFDKVYQSFAKKGQRLIGFAQKKFQSESELTKYQGDVTSDSMADYKFLGMLAMADPPKEGVAEAVDKLKGANIRVFMVTGDHPITAEAIARQVHIVTRPVAMELSTLDQTRQLPEDHPNALIVHGDLIDVLDGVAWAKVLAAPEIVFARTLPRHKLLIVTHLQSLGDIVGVKLLYCPLLNFL